MSELAKKIILEANENIKAAAQCFELLYKEMELHPDLVTNVNMALGELIKCIKHSALVQGDITGKELMPIESLEKAAIAAKPAEDETVN
jgi:hypothetical protein